MDTHLNRYLNPHLKGEPATPPIAPFPSCLTSLLLLAGNRHAASSRLASQLGKGTLGCVQLPFLGSNVSLSYFRGA